MPSSRNLSALLALVAMLGAASVARAQGNDAYIRAQDLEQNERFPEAAQAYRQALAESPRNLPALLGLERVYAQLGRSDSLLPLLDTLIADQPSSAPLREAQLRTLRTLGDRDRLRAAYDRWRHDVPRDPTPYREYARMLIADGFTQQADTVLRQAQQAVGTGRGFEYELAQLRAALGMWELSAQSWREAVADNAYLAQAATFSLMPVPPATRAAVRRILGAPPALVAPRKVLAALDLAWGSPRDGWDALHALTPDTAALAAWTDFAQHAEEAGAWLVARDALIAIGRHQTSPEIVARAAGDAIRGGDALSAVALAQAAEQRLDSATAASTVVPTHLEALSTLGRAADGERLVSAYGAKLSPDQKQRLLRTLAWGWIRAGDVGKARALMAQAGEGGDAAAIGWIALYDGDLATARKRLKPTPDASPDLISALALLSRTKADSAPVAGRAFLTLARGDTIAAAGSFEAAAKQLPDAAPLLLAMAARLYESRHDDAKAIALWQSIVAGAPDAPEAPEAELEWARSLRRTGQNALAVQRLEHLILTWPQSALVPQARRELELAKQTVPSAS